MTYEQALSYIHGASKYGIKEGLTGVAALLERLGSPHKALRYVHVAGTNGKGTACAILASILVRAGYKTGLNISPYLTDFRERFQINGRMIRKRRMAALTARVRAAADAIVAGGCAHPTEFELVTAMAFLYFAQENCDAVVLEVGMGGRLDSTNIIERAEASVIMAIGMDHMQYLGGGIAEIAGEKAGIIKPGGRVVLYPDQHPDALRVINARARDQRAELIVPDTREVEIVSESLGGSVFSYGGHQYETPFAGTHQILNSLTAVVAAHELRGAFPLIDDKAIYDGLLEARNPGRLELFSGEPPILLDGAHNTQAVDALCDFIRAQLAERPLVAVMGMLADKDYAYCIDAVARLAHAFVAVAPASPRALKAGEAAHCARACANVREASGVQQALGLARSLCPDGGVILCCGSLFLAGEMRMLLAKLDM